MKPLPAQQAPGSRPQSEAIPSLPGPLAAPSGRISSANRRTTTCPTQRVYPWLLSISTATAALFCLMYITKPVMISTPAPLQAEVPANPVKSPPARQGVTPAPASLMPSGDRLPGERLASAQASKPIPADPRRDLPSPPSTSAFEETNLRIQHILTAEAPGGHLARIDIDVPVLYRSRSLRWTAQEVAGARDLLARLMDYQEKSRQLRAEGLGLLDAWNHLIEKSIPSSELRADSPSLPANQQDAADTPLPAGLITTESIQIQTSGK
jgi:hypothetical protein